MEMALPARRRGPSALERLLDRLGSRAVASVVLGPRREGVGRHVAPLGRTGAPRAGEVIDMM
jgi:hypothetical protein